MAKYSGLLKLKHINAILQFSFCKLLIPLKQADLKSLSKEDSNFSNEISQMTSSFEGKESELIYSISFISLLSNLIVSISTFSNFILYFLISLATLMSKLINEITYMHLIYSYSKNLKMNINFYNIQKDI